MKIQNLKTKETNAKGITLVALIVTIIVLLILAGVTIITLTGDNGLLTKSKSAVDKYSEGEIEEKIKLAYQEWQLAQFTGTTENANDFIKNRLEKIYGDNSIEDVCKTGNSLMVTFKDIKIYSYNISTGKVIDLTNTNNISKSEDENFVGYYADIDADGTVDGVIFVDLLTGSIRETQQWGNSDGEYKIDKRSASDVKNYYISQDNYKWANIQESKPVLSPKGKGIERFYVMALSDFTTPAYTDKNDETKSYQAYTSYSFYKNAYGKMSPLITSSDFGEGKENTRKMIEKWNLGGTSDGYTDAIQGNQDIWKHIQTKYSEGWFIPSRAEWAAFANEFEITYSNHSSLFKLSGFYWSSSQVSNSTAWNIFFYRNFMGERSVDGIHSVRLATTF